MAERLDVAGRLAEGRPAVEHTQTYVRACQVLGYHDPELTSRPNQIRDWYDSEEGLDLRALDGDCAQLRAAVGAVMEALQMQRAQVDELAAAWSGPGAESAVAFLQRHCEAANAVATEVRAAAQRCESLRDNLWHLVDVKVATAIAVDDRTLANRPAWMAAAAAVTTGAGEPKTAEVVQQQITPYVDNDIRAEWLTAMRSARDGVATSYDMVIDKFAAAAPVYFEIPVDQSPGRAPFQPVPAAAPAVLAPAVALPALAPDPAPAAMSTPAAPASAFGTSAAPAPLTPPTSDWGTAMGDGSALPGGLGSAAGLDGLGGLGGLGGLANRIVDEMSGLLASAGDELDDPSGLDDPLDADGPDDKAPDDEADDDEADDAESAAEPDKPADIQAAQAEEAKPADAPPLAGPPAADMAPAATPPIDAPPPGARPPDAAAPVSGKTPCEIAADELPKAGQ
jgi:hypothetical protein